MDNTLIVHEMGHGISNRMTGGGSARCLQSVESRSLGEGWSDALSEYVVYHTNSTSNEPAALVGTLRLLPKLETTGSLSTRRIMPGGIAGIPSLSIRESEACNS